MMHQHKVQASVFDALSAHAQWVKAVNLFNMPPDAPLSFFSPGQHVMTDLAMHIVHTSAIYTGLPVKGYKLKQVALYSLQASGAIPLWTAGYNDKKS